jgi:hypothetical protein
MSDIEHVFCINYDELDNKDAKKSIKKVSRITKKLENQFNALTKFLEELADESDNIAYKDKTMKITGSSVKLTGLQNIFGISSSSESSSSSSSTSNSNSNSAER